MGLEDIVLNEISHKRARIDRWHLQVEIRQREKLKVKLVLSRVYCTKAKDTLGEGRGAGRNKFNDTEKIKIIF